MCLIDFVFDHVVLLLGNFPATSYLLAQATIPRRGLGDGSRAYLVRRGNSAPFTPRLSTGRTPASVYPRSGSAPVDRTITAPCSWARWRATTVRAHQGVPRGRQQHP